MDLWLHVAATFFILVEPVTKRMFRRRHRRKRGFAKFVFVTFSLAVIWSNYFLLHPPSWKFSHPDQKAEPRNISKELIQKTLRYTVPQNAPQQTFKVETSQIPNLIEAREIAQLHTDGKFEEAYLRAGNLVLKNPDFAIGYVML